MAEHHGARGTGRVAVLAWMTMALMAVTLAACKTDPTEAVNALVEQNRSMATKKIEGAREIDRLLREQPPVTKDEVGPLSGPVPNFGLPDDPGTNADFKYASDFIELKEPQGPDDWIRSRVEGGFTIEQAKLLLETGDYELKRFNPSEKPSPEAAQAIFERLARLRYVVVLRNPRVDIYAADRPRWIEGHDEALIFDLDERKLVGAFRFEEIDDKPEVASDRTTVFRGRTKAEAARSYIDHLNEGVGDPSWPAQRGIRAKLEHFFPNTVLPFQLCVQD